MCLVAVVIQSFGPIIVRKIDLGGIGTSFHRSWLGAAFTIGLLYLRGERLSWRALRLSVWGGITFGLNVATFFVAVKNTSIANAATIAALQPILLLLVVNRFFGERPGGRVWIFTLLSLGGVALVVQGSERAGTGRLSGDLLAFAAMVLFAAYYVASKHARTALTTLEYQASLLVVASVVLIPIALLSGERLRIETGDWPYLWLMVLVPGTGHLLINYAVQYVPLVVPSVLNLWVPVGATLAAWVLLGESLVLLQILGVSACVLSLGLLVWSTSRTAPG